MSKTSKQIKKLIQEDKYDQAEVLIRKELKEETYWINRWQNYHKEQELADALRFNSHWLWNRLALCYYERRQYKLALRYDLKALEIAPNCPMNLWNYAGSLDMLGRTDEAIAIYKRLLGIGAKKIIARKVCGEYTRDAYAMLTDCRYRLGRCYQDKGDLKTAEKWLKLNLRLRKNGETAIYKRREVLKALEEL